MEARKLIKSMMLSMMAHPDYINPKMGEFRDYVSMAQDYLDKTKPKQTSAEIDEEYKSKLRDEWSEREERIFGTKTEEEAKPKLSSLIGKLSKQGGEEMIRQIKDFRMGIEWGFSEADAIKVKEIDIRLKEWVETHLRKIGISKDSHPAYIVAAGLTIKVSYQPYNDIYGRKTTYTLYRHGEKIDEMTFTAVYDSKDSDVL